MIEPDFLEEEIGSVVKVLWLDSGKWHSDGWQDKDTVVQQKLEQVYTIGLLFHITDDTIYVAQTADLKDRQFFGVQLIARGNIVNVRKLVAA